MKYERAHVRHRTSRALAGITAEVDRRAYRCRGCQVENKARRGGEALAARSVTGNQGPDPEGGWRTHNTTVSHSQVAAMSIQRLRPWTVSGIHEYISESGRQARNEVGSLV